MKKIINFILLFGLLIPTSVSAANIDGQKWNNIQQNIPENKLKEIGVVGTPAILKKLHVDWQKPTGGKYPNIKKQQGINILVSLTKQRVYIKADNKVIYTMICSSGTGNNTPKGDFAIEPERGETFYNPALKEGANYWTSFKDHGIYLFHTVPTDEKGEYKSAEADKLGTKASHGCVRLSVPDAKWINDNIAENTKVKVK